MSEDHREKPFYSSARATTSTTVAKREDENGVSDRRSLTLRYRREGETKEESPFEDFQRLIGEHTEENQQ